MAVDIKRTSAAGKGDCDVMPVGAHYGSAGNENRGRATGLSPDEMSGVRIGGVEGEDVVRELAVRLACENSAEAAAAIGILCSRPLHPHADSSSGGGIKTAPAGDTY